MKKILIYYRPNVIGISDFRPTNYYEVVDRSKEELNGKIPNFGNKVWLQAILSEISTSDCTYDFGYDDLSEDYINNNYDLVLMPLANCFHKGWIPYMEKRASHIEKLNIPVYVIACGVQADSYDELDSLVECVKEPATRFIKSVYNTGGEFALRGYFTQEFFKKLGFNSAVVTGCPSLFQMGRNLQISTDKVDKKDFKSAINGTFNLPVNDRDIKKSDFICQDKCGKFLYDPEFFKNNPHDLRRILKLVKRGEYPFVRALANNKIHLFADTQQWMNYYTHNDINFSFGSRIHGTIIPILSGVPSLCYSKDARTREMIEFFDIPHIIASSPEDKKRSMYEWYCSTDYTTFNRRYKEKFDAFESFLNTCGITRSINQNNTFMQIDNDSFEFPPIINKQYIEAIRKIVKLYNIPIRIINTIYHI